MKMAKNWNMPGCEGRFYVRGKKNIIWYRMGISRVTTGLEYSPQNKILAGEKIQNIEINRTGTETVKIMTILDAYKYFLEKTRGTKAKSTLEGLDYALKQLISADHLMTDYTAIRNDIALNLTKVKYSNISKNTRLVSLKAFFQYFVDYEFIERNPITKKMLLKTVEKPVEVLTQEELYSIFEYFDKYNNNTKYYFKILYYCAFRRQEAVNMNWENVIDENGNFRENIIIPVSKFGNKVDKFPLSEELKKMFVEIGVKKEGKIFDFEAHTYYLKFKKALLKNNITAKTYWSGNLIGLHILRKTRISEWLFIQKLPVQIVSELARDNINTIMRYYAKLPNRGLHEYLK